MAARHFKLLATVIPGKGNCFYRTAMVKRQQRPEQMTWTETQIAFSIDHPDDWSKHSYGNVNQARSSFGPAVRKLGPDADVDPDIIRITLWPNERKVRMD